MLTRGASVLALSASVLGHGVLLGGADRALSMPPQAPGPVTMLARLDEAALVSVEVAMAAPAPVMPAARPKAAASARPAPVVARTAPPVSDPVVAEPESDASFALPAEPEPAPAAEEETAPDELAGPVGEAEPAHVDEESDEEPVLLAAAKKPATPEPRTVDLSGWPAQGSILFRVTHGNSGFQVGEAQHKWSHDGKRYEMEVVLQTTGVAALVKEFHYVQRSVGSIGKTGLRPERFSVEQQGKKPESADFDWSGGKVVIHRKKGDRVADIRAGDQDVLSLWHQIGIVGAAGLPLDLTVVSNKAASPSRLTAVGQESLALPIGTLDTQHLRAQANDGALTIDIWLARKYGMLPVRIRITDDKGDVFDQQAVNLRLAPAGRVGGEEGATEMVELREEKLPSLSLYE